MNASRPSRRAFTIVEAITVMSILAVIGSVVSSIVYTASRSYADGAFTAQLQGELSAAMARAARELRYIPIDATSSAMVPKIDTVTASSINWNSNSSLSLNSGRLELVLNGAAPEVLLQNVTSLSISAFDESNTALGASLSGAQCYTIRRIQIQFTASRDGVTQTLRSRVFIRGLMSAS